MTITCLRINASGGAPSYSALQERQVDAVLYGGGGPRPLGAVSGVRPGGGLAVSATSSTAWSVSPGACIVDPAFTTTQGAYRVASDAAVTGSINAAGSNPRIDLIYVQVGDTDIDTSGTRAATINYLAGTASASPVAPTLPARSLALGYINVPASGGGNPSASPAYQFSVASGGILPVASYAAMMALTPYTGMVIDRIDLDQLYRWGGPGQWQMVADTSSWRTYTPTWNASVGTSGGGIYGWWKQSAKEVKWKVQVVLGTGGSAAPNSGPVLISLPVVGPSAPFGQDTEVGNCTFQGGATAKGTCFLYDQGNFLFGMKFHGSANNAWASTGNPGTWGNGTHLTAHGFYDLP